MRFVLIAVGVVLALVSGTLMSPLAREPGRRSGRSFESVGFARAASATRELASRFPWPATTAFQTTHQRSSGAEPIRLVRGRAAWWSEPDPRREELPDVVWGLRRGVGEKAIVFFWIPGSPHGGSLEGLPEFHTTEWFKSLGQPFVHAAGSSNFEFVPANHASAVTLDPRAWEDWTYTTTLLAMDRPLYETLSRSPSADPEADWQANGARVEKVTRAMKQGGDAGLAAIRAVLAENVPLNDDGGAEVASFAQKQGASELAVNVRSRHLPVGRCSMDLGAGGGTTVRRGPFRCRKLYCFLNLHIQIMGDRFQRIAYSSSERPLSRPTPGGCAKSASTCRSSCAACSISSMLLDSNAVNGMPGTIWSRNSRSRTSTP